jgi:hypothetical protein
MSTSNHTQLKLQIIPTLFNALESHQYLQLNKTALFQIIIKHKHKDKHYYLWLFLFFYQLPSHNNHFTLAKSNIPSNQAKPSSISSLDSTMFIP